MSRSTLAACLGLSTLFFAPWAHSGGWNGTQITKTKAWGSAKVVNAGNKASIHELKVPKVHGRLTCTKSTFRVKRLGHHNYPTTSTVRNAYDLVPQILDPVSGMHKACMAGQGAMLRRAQVTGLCVAVKFGFGANSVDFKKRDIPFALDCRGYVSQGRSRALTLYYNPKTKDNVSVASAADRAWAERNGFRPVRIQGQVLAAASRFSGGTQRLYLYHNAARRDYVTVAHRVSLAKVKAAGYKMSRVIGHVYKTPGTGGARLPLTSYFSTSRQDGTVVSTPAGKAAASGAGYAFKRIEGYVDVVKRY